MSDDKRERGIKLAIEALSELDGHHIPSSSTMKKAREAMHLLVVERQRPIVKPAMAITHAPRAPFAVPAPLSRAVYEEHARRIEEEMRRADWMYGVPKHYFTR